MYINGIYTCKKRTPLRVLRGKSITGQLNFFSSLVILMHKYYFPSDLMFSFFSSTMTSNVSSFLMINLAC